VTVAARPDLAAAVDDRPADPLREVVTSLEWVRRKLHAAESPHASLLDEIIECAGSNRNGRDALTDPWTARWIAVAITLIDRGAPSLLPAGQTAAHFGQAVNLLAALRVGQVTTEIRFDRDGVAWLPGTGACVRGSTAIAGSVASLVPNKSHEVDDSDLPLRWPEITSTAFVDGADAQFCEAGSLGPGLHQGPRHEGQAPSDAPEATEANSDSRALVSRWPGRMREHPPNPLEDFVLPRDLAMLLAAQGIPVDVTPNTLASGSIRLDSSFDHLSLLSIRSPQDFERIALAATRASDRLSRRIQGHVAYIERRYTHAAAIYAALLVECPGDTDLWRDVCWALRHAGHEDLVLAWVLHPSEVVQVAEEVDWQNDGSDGPASSGEPLDGIIRYLEWVGNAVRTR
jgi:hypothetical protein